MGIGSAWGQGYMHMYNYMHVYMASTYMYVLFAVNTLECEESESKLKSVFVEVR